MTLSTLIHAGLTHSAEPRTALVLMGGGARTAYQAGALKALGQILATSKSHGAPAAKLPFQLLIGTSAGALNASFLAARASQGLPALDALAQFWSELRSKQVYRLHVPKWTRLSRIATAWHLSRQIRESGALLDTLPLADTLHRAISLRGIDEALASKALQALAITASSYSSGVNWTFCHTARDDQQRAWSRPGRRAEFQPITMEHLMASSAIPLIFPAQPLWVDGRSEFFGDGSMRQTSPLSPALHLGAHKMLVIGVGQPERSGFGSEISHSSANTVSVQNLKEKRLFSHVNNAPNAMKLIAPGVSGVLGHALASVFHDTLLSDVEQAQRMNHTLSQLPREVAAAMPYRKVEVISLQPSESLDELARQSAHALPAPVRSVLSSLAGKAGTQGAAAGLASYLLFEPEFTQPLMALGQRDAHAKKDELLAFFAE